MSYAAEVRMANSVAAEPMAKVETRTQHFRRTPNGAWSSKRMTTETNEVAVSMLGPRWARVGLTQSRTITWPDGHAEHFSFNNSMQLTGPGDSRLLPDKVRRAKSTWYIDSRKLYERKPDGSIVAHDLPLY